MTRSVEYFSQQQLNEFLRSIFAADITYISSIKSGMRSQTVSFTSGEETYVLRINREKLPFAKDIYAHKHFCSHQLPIPEIIKEGKIDSEHTYAITKKAVGHTLADLSKQQEKKYTSSLIAVLDAIRITPILSYGYGEWDEKGTGKHSSWKQYIARIFDGTQVRDTRVAWDEVYKVSYADKEYIESILWRINKLMKHLPDERYLVHGDFGYDNIIGFESNISAVLDWSESQYGDFLYDVAYLDFWSDNINYTAEIKKHYEKIGLFVPDFDERLLCYKLYTGVSGMGISALLDDEEDYIATKKRVEKLKI